MLTGRPAICGHLHADVVGDRVVLLGEGQQALLRGRPYAKVLPLLDGRRTADEIVDALAEDIPPRDVYRALCELQRRGYVEEAPAAPGPSAAFWSAQGVAPADAEARLRAARVTVIALGTTPGEELAAALLTLGIHPVARPDAGLWVVLADDYLRPELADLNRQALEGGRPWLLARPSGRFAWLGPLFVPEATACWECLAQRQRANRELEEFIRNPARGPDGLYPARAATTATISAAVGMLATAIAQWAVTGPASPLRSTVISFDALALRTQEHVLVRRPQCRACGDPRPAACGAPALPAPGAPAAASTDGGYRTVAPEETLRRYGHHVSPITGVVRGLSRVSADDGSPVHVYVAGHNLSMRADSLSTLRKTLRSSACGKGTTDAQARASSLCEAIERYSGVFRGDEPRVRAAFAALGEQAIDPRDCMLFSAEQYRDRERWSSAHSFDAVPRPFDPEAVLDWTPLWSMTHGQPRYLPTGYCYYSYPAPAGGACCHSDSNGCAAGNTVGEAVLQACMELAERDAVAIWWYNQLRRPGLDLDSFDDPFVARMREHYRTLSRSLWVLDITSDLGIPSLVAVSAREDGPPEDIIFAPAAHPDVRIALLRTLTELNQMIPGVERRSTRTGGYAYDDANAVRWWSTETLAGQPYLTPAPGAPARSRADFPDAAGADIAGGIAGFRSAVEQAGLEMLVLDQTRPDIGLPVVRVVVPGLRHFWPRYAPGRLFDVPVHMGWTAVRREERDLNPIAVFI